MKLSDARLKGLIEEATVDAYNESEQRVGFLTMIESNLDAAFHDTHAWRGGFRRAYRHDFSGRDRRHLSARSNAPGNLDTRTSLAHAGAGGRRMDRSVSSLGAGAVGAHLSEYQYYEFQAIDRPLTQSQIQELRRYSTRATITPTRFVNEYHWGSFKGNPVAWMEKSLRRFFLPGELGYA